MKLFGVFLTALVLVGALVGGVVGVLLPKISSGLALGFLVSLFLGVVSMHTQPMNILVPPCRYLTQTFELFGIHSIDVIHSENHRWSTAAWRVTLRLS
jgi:hypothetical protein